MVTRDYQHSAGRGYRTSGKQNKIQRLYRSLPLLAFSLASAAALIQSCSPAGKGKEGDGTAAQPERIVYSVEIKGAITPATMERLSEAITTAEQKDAVALLVLLNTPGGLMHSMDEMCRDILNSRIPVITYVYPPGAYAGSAGVYIMYSSHLAVMAPATNIGSATPVTMGGGGEKKTDGKKNDRIPEKAGTDDQTNLKRKLFNHAKAQIRGFAEYHGRNARFAERTITYAANITSTEALRINAIDMIADSPEQLLRKAQGHRIRLATGYQKLNLRNTRIVKIKNDFRNEFLAVLTNPVIVNLLMMIGVLGIMAEIQYPGSVFPGTIGAICLILGLYAMQTLPVNYAGLGLIILGVIFFILEIKVISYGMLSVAGIASMLIGSVLLARDEQGIIAGALIPILITTGLISAIMLFLVYKAIEVTRRRPVSGWDALIQEKGRATTRIDEHGGQVFLNSEIWKARPNNPNLKIEKGTAIRVVGRSGMELLVEPLDDSPQ